MELSYQLFIGALAAVLAGLFNTAAAPVYASVGLRAHHAIWRASSVASQIATLAVHVLAGIGLSLLFWLSWGLAAVVGVPWWMRGLAFALVLWLGGCVPLLVAQLLTVRIHWTASVVAALEWLVTLLFVGLGCAWMWVEGP